MLACQHDYQNTDPRGIDPSPSVGVPYSLSPCLSVFSHRILRVISLEREMIGEGFVDHALAVESFTGAPARTRALPTAALKQSQATFPILR